MTAVASFTDPPVLAAAFAVFWVVVMIAALRRFLHPSQGDELSIGALDNCDVALIEGKESSVVTLGVFAPVTWRVSGYDEKWSQRFKLRAGLSPREARMVAQWLRLAATPGANLAEARRNSRTLAAPDRANCQSPRAIISPAAPR